MNVAKLIADYIEECHPDAMKSDGNAEIYVDAMQAIYFLCKRDWDEYLNEPKPVRPRIDRRQYMTPEFKQKLEADAETAANDAEYMAECALWDVTVGDGLEEEEKCNHCIN